MRRIDFDYPETCPKIDNVAQKIQSLFEEYLPDEDIENELWKLVDGFRTINADMRVAADDQISDLKTYIQYLESELADVKKERDDLYKTIWGTNDDDE